MRTEAVMRARLATLLLLALAAPGAFAASAAPTAEGGGYGSDWRSWQADTQVGNLASLQRGARNFFSYCAGCHSLKYVRYSRLAQDLAIPLEMLERYLIPPGDRATDYVLTAMPQADAEAWFGIAPPDLSLIVRARGADHVYQFLRTFYVDPSKPTGANNLVLEGTAMPHVLADLEGLKRAVFTNVEHGGVTQRAFRQFEEVTPGRMNAQEYATFVRDIVTFLDYASEPTQLQRRGLGVWVVLFLLVFTWLAWLLKREYWRDVH